MILSIPIGLLIVLLLFGSALVGMLIARRLPQHHLSEATKSVVSVSTAVVGTLSALVLGLLITSGSASFMTKTKYVSQISADAITLDRLLRRYGPETSEVRTSVREYIVAKLHDLFPPRGEAPDLANTATVGLFEHAQTELLELAPTNDTQRWLKAEALQLTDSILTTRWQLAQEDSSRPPLELLVLVLFWFVVIFTGFGLFAPRNATAIVAILLCAVGVGAAVRMTTELYIPFRGLVRISSEPLANALEKISH